MSAPSEPGSIHDSEEARELEDFIENDIDNDFEITGDAPPAASHNAQQTAQEAEEARIARETLQRCRDLENDLIAHVNDLRASVYADEGQMKAVIDANIVKGLRNVLRRLNQRSDLAHKRLGELIILDERMGIVPRLLLPLWNVARVLHETETLELLLFIFQKISNLPNDEWLRQYDKPGVYLDSYLDKLEKFKRDLLVDHFFKGLDLLSTKFRLDMKLNGLSQKDWDLRISVQGVLEALKGNEVLPVSSVEIETGIAKDSDDVQTAGRIIKATRFLEAMDEKQAQRRERIGRAALAMRLLILNLMKIRYKTLNTEDRPQHRLISLLFAEGLHAIYENEWRLLIESGGWNSRDSRSSERRDQHGLLLGDDKTILWRNLEFYYQLLQQLSPKACGYFLSTIFMLSDEERQQSLDFVARVQAREGEATLSSVQKELVHLGAVLARSTRFNPNLRRRAAEQNIQSAPWMARTDKRRYQPMTRTVHVETMEEKIQQGEMPQLAMECLVGRDNKGESPQKAQDLIRTLGSDVTNKFMQHLYDFVTIAFRRMLTGWLQDAVLESSLMAAATLSRMMNLITWVLRCLREMTELLFDQSEQWRQTEEGAQFFNIKISQGVAIGRGGLDDKAIAFVTNQLKQEIKKKAKARSFLLLRCCLRMIVEQQQWALFFVEKSKDSRLEAIGKYIFQEHVHKGLPTTLVKLLRDYTSSRAERHFFLLVVTAMHQMLRASPSVPALSKIKQTRRVFHKRFGGDAGTSFFSSLAEEQGLQASRMSDNAELSIFVGAVREPKILTKLLHTLADSAALHPSIIECVIGLVMCVAEHKWTSTVLAWNLAYVRLFHAILTTKLSILEAPQRMIKHSVYALAEIHKTNRFATAEVLFAALLLHAGYDDANLVKDYTLPEDNRTGVFRASTTYSGAWTPKEIQRLLNLYEKFRYEGPRRLLRHLRREMRGRMPDDIAMKLSSLKIIDPASAGFDITDKCYSFKAVEALLSLVLEEEQLIDDLISMKDTSSEYTFEELKKAADNHEPIRGAQVSILKLRLLTAETLLKNLDLVVDTTYVEEKDGSDILYLSRRLYYDEEAPLAPDLLDTIRSWPVEDLITLKMQRQMRRTWISQAPKYLNESWDTLGNELLGILILEIRSNNEIDLVPLISLVENMIRVRKADLMQSAAASHHDRAAEPQHAAEDKQVAAEETNEDYFTLFDWHPFLALPTLYQRSLKQALTLFGLELIEVGRCGINKDFPLVALEYRFRRLRGYVRMAIEDLRSIMEREVFKRADVTGRFGREASQEITVQEEPDLEKKKIKKLLGAVITYKKALCSVTFSSQRLGQDVDRCLDIVAGWAFTLVYRRANNKSEWSETQDLIFADDEEEDEEGERENLPDANMTETTSESARSFHMDLEVLKEEFPTNAVVTGNLDEMRALKLEPLMQQKAFNYPLGAAKDFLELQNILSCLGGAPNQVYQPTEWRWKKYKTNSMQLFKSVLFIKLCLAVTLETLIELKHSLTKAESDTWERLLAAFRDPEINANQDSLFSDDLFADKDEPELDDDVVQDDLFGEAEMEREAERQLEQSRRNQWAEVKRRAKERARQQLLDEEDLDTNERTNDGDEDGDGDEAESSDEEVESLAQPDEEALQATDDLIWDGMDIDDGGEDDDIFAGAYIGL